MNKQLIIILALIFGGPGLASSQSQSQSQSQSPGQWHLGSETQISSGMVCGPANYSPDGKKIAWTGKKNKGLWLKSLATKETSMLSMAKGVGYGYRWTADSQAIIARQRISPGAGKKLFSLVSIDINDKKIVTISRAAVNTIPPRYNHNLNVANLSLPVAGSTIRPFTAQGKVWLFDQANNSQEVLASNSHGAELAPNGQFVSYLQGDNITIYNLKSRETRVIAQGSSPAWSPDSQWLAFSKTVDNNIDVIAADIYFCHLASAQCQQLTNTASRIELFPAWAPDGRSLLYTDHLSGNIFCRSLVLEEDGQ